MALALLPRVQQIPALAGANAIYLQNLIDAASNLLENYCNRVFLTTAHADELHDGDGSQVLLVRNIPITVLTSVKTVEADSTEITCLGAQFRMDAGMGEIRPAPNCTCTYCFFPRGFRNIKVSYTAGLGLTADVLPEDIQEACGQLCAWLHEMAATAAGAVKAWKLGDAAVTYVIPVVGTSAIPQTVKQLIGPYRKFVP